jgi:hypothetical protein
LRERRTWRLEGSRVSQLLLDVVASGRAAAIVPALGRPQREPRVAVRHIAEGRFARALYASTRASDRLRPSTNAVITAYAAKPDRTRSGPRTTLSFDRDGRAAGAGLRLMRALAKTLPREQ